MAELDDERHALAQSVMVSAEEWNMLALYRKAPPRQRGMAMLTLELCAAEEPPKPQLLRLVPSRSS